MNNNSGWFGYSVGLMVGALIIHKEIAMVGAFIFLVWTLIDLVMEDKYG